MANINDVRRMSKQRSGQSKKLENARDAHPDADPDPDGDDDENKQDPITVADYNAIDSAFDHYAGRDWNTEASQRDRLTQLRISAQRALAERPGKPLTDFDSIDDVNALLNAHADAGASGANTQRGYSAALRAFFGYLDGHGDWPEFPFHDDIAPKTGLGDGDDDDGKISPDEILGWSDIIALQRHASHPRNKAFIVFLADTGLRIAAACQLRVGDIHGIDGDAPTFSPNERAIGQKGLNSHEMGEFPIHDSVAYLRPWLNSQHPEAPDPHPDAPLFPIRRGYDSENRAECAPHPRTMQNAIDKAADAAGIDKPHNVHAFRHCAVKRLKLEYDYDWVDLRDALAWDDSSVSQMAQRYGSLSSPERLERLQAKRGVDIDDDGDDEPAKQECRNCGTLVDQTARFCPQCRVTLDEDKADRQPAATAAELNEVKEDHNRLVRMFQRVLDSDDEISAEEIALFGPEVDPEATDANTGTDAVDGDAVADPDDLDPDTVHGIDADTDATDE